MTRLNPTRASKKPILLCLMLVVAASLLLLTACSADQKLGENTELSKTFLDHVFEDRYDEAYAMVKNAGTETEFRTLWDLLQTTLDGAGSYEMEQIGWYVSTSNDVTSRVTAFQITTDNGKILLLRTTTQDAIEGLTGVYFSDSTEFIQETNAYVPTVNIILAALSILAIVYTVIMVIDCIRHHVKYKALWILLMLFGISFTFTIGTQNSNFSFALGFFVMPSSIVADPGLQAVVLKLFIPVGTIIYTFLRKKMLIPPAPAETIGDMAGSPAEPETSPAGMAVETEVPTDADTYTAEDTDIHSPTDTDTN